MDDMRLVAPSEDTKTAALEFRQDFFSRGEERIFGSAGFYRAESYESWLEKLRLNAVIKDPGYAPSDTYFAAEGGRIVGIISIRHRLTDFLMREGGHIGYSVRPSDRSKGYATRMLAFALEKCRELGIEKILVTCDKDNPASAGTIIKNGGVLENEAARDDGNVIQRYWITV